MFEDVFYLIGNEVICSIANHVSLVVADLGAGESKVYELIKDQESCGQCQMGSGAYLSYI